LTPKRLYTVVGLALLTITIVYLLILLWSGTKVILRQLSASELTTLTKRADKGDCEASYQVAWHHMYFTLDDVATIRHLRTAAKCGNAQAYEGLIATFGGRPEYAKEAADALMQLRRLDPERAKIV
jgi:hypothetical protein